MSGLAEQRLGHPGVLATSELSQIVRVANRARAEKASLLACSTVGWSQPADQNWYGYLNHTQDAASTRDFAPTFRGFVSIPQRTTRLRIVTLCYFPVSDFVMAFPKASVSDGTHTDSVSTRTIEAGDFTVSSSTTATFTVEEGHGVRLGQLIWTTDFTSNIAETSPAIVIGMTSTQIACVMTSSMSNGSKGSGTMHVPADFVVDTASNDDEGHIVGGIEVDYNNTFVWGSRTPTPIEVVIPIENIDTSSGPTTAAVLVEMRCRTATSIVEGQVVIGEALCRYAPILTMVYAEVDEDDLTPSPLEISAGDEITSTLLTAMNAAVGEASLKEVTHASMHCGGVHWDDYVGAPTQGGLVRDVDVASTAVVHDFDVYLDEDAELNVGLLHTLSSGTWVAKVYVDGVLTVTSGTLTTMSSAELILSTATISAGWRRVQVEYSGSGAICPRAVRVTEETYLATPAND